MTRFDVTLSSWNSPAPLAGNTGLYVSRQSGWLQNLWTDAETCVHCTLYKHLSTIPAVVTSDLKQRLIGIYGQAYYKTSSTKQLVNGERGYVQKWGKRRTSLWTSAILKPALFWTNTLHNRLFFRTTNSLPRKTRCFASFPLQLFKSK